PRRRLPRLQRPTSSTAAAPSADLRGPLCEHACPRCFARPDDRVKPAWTAQRDSAKVSPVKGNLMRRGDAMQRITIFLLGLLVGGALMVAVPVGRAHDDLTGGLTTPENHPLLVHMTSGDAWRGANGLEFAQAMLKIGHPVAVFLNLEAVRL